MLVWPTLPLSMTFMTWYKNILKKYNYNKVFARHYNVYQIRIIKYCFDGFKCIIYALCLVKLAQKRRLKTQKSDSFCVSLE